jgi:hypothetical protein
MFNTKSPLRNSRKSWKLAQIEVLRKSFTAPRKWSWSRIAFHFGTKLVWRKSAQGKSSQNSNVAMRIQCYVNIKEKNVEEWMYFLQGATRHLTKKCKYGSDVTWDIVWINACMLWPSLERLLPTNHVRKGGKRVIASGPAWERELAWIGEKIQQYKSHHLLVKTVHCSVR